ncbi:MAG: hypothetical protein OES84_00255 [Kiritimatiellaceae bacterium]|nr:hypothetical protein [Kiritimatiellaceae bacterium]
MTQDEYNEAFEERAAIMEEGCKWSREKSEYEARQCVNEEQNRRNLKDTPAHRTGIYKMKQILGE